MGFKKQGGTLLIWTAILLLMLSGSGFCEDTVTIIANPSVSVDEITKDTLKKIFTGQQVAWSNGQPAKPALLSDGETQTRFVSNYIDKTPSQFQTYWRKMVFTGQGIQPPAFDSEQKLIDYVAGTAGAIGYISSSTKAANTKTLHVTGK